MDSPWKEKLAAVEEELARALPAEVDAAWIRRYAGEAASRRHPQALAPILAPARELLGRGGKRWRPLVLLSCAEMFGGPWRQALPLTALVEIAHNGSLIVDDVEDSSPERRGAPAVHVIFGLDSALNTGNLMYFLPARTVEQADLDPARQLSILRRYVENMVRLHLGQGLDILWHRDHDRLPTEPEYLEMCRLKTGSLSRLAAQIGALAAGATEAQADLLGAVGGEFGACFQVIDDVANLATGVPGKLRGDDIIEGKKSLPIILHLQRRPGDRDQVRDCFVAAAADPQGAAGPIAELVARLESSGSLSDARGKAEQLLGEAEATLQREFPPSAGRQQLLELVSSLVRS